MGPSQWVSKLILCLRCLHPIWIPIPGLSAPSAVQLGANSPGEAAKWFKFLVPYTHVGDPEVPISPSVQNQFDISCLELTNKIHVTLIRTLHIGVLPFLLTQLDAFQTHCNNLIKVHFG